MRAERYESVCDLADQVRDLDTQERHRQLTRLCEGDESLGNEVERFLRCESQVRKGFPEPLGLFGDLSRFADEMIGARVGSYEIKKLIAHGGMGSVYLATRVQDYDHRVAIKILKQGLGSRQAEMGFARERQVLAGLKHPNIATLHDGGQLGERPYYVMELVDGLGIDEYCEQNRLGLHERLRLFQAICEGVQFAHQNMVVHRDLKPSNILVTRDGVPRLLDFGIAKLLVNQERSFEGSSETLPDGDFLTWEYASPEQVRQDQNIGATSDVYSLGVILYKLLTGQRPYDLDGLSEQDRRQTIGQGPVLPPSLAMQPDPSTESTKRESGKQRKRSLAGDVDAIVMKALHKDPRDRYQTVREFSGDIQNYLDHLPVEARAGGQFYRLRKLLARRKWSFVAVAAVLFSLVTGSTFATWGWLRARAEERKAIASATVAQEKKEQAQENLRIAREAVQKFLTGISQDPRLREHDLESLRKELLRTAVPFLEAFVEQEWDEPELDAERGKALGDLASIASATGEHEAAMAYLHKAREIFHKLAADHQETTSYQRYLAVTHNRIGILCRTTGKGEMAEKAFTEARKIYRLLLADRPDDPEALSGQATAEGNLANLYEATKRLPEAREAHLAARDGFRKLTEVYPEVADHVEKLAATHSNLGTFYDLVGESEQAEASHLEGLRLRRRLHDQYRADPHYLNLVAVSLHNLGTYYSDRHRTKEAEKMLGEAEQIYQELTRTHPTIFAYKDARGKSLDNLGTVLVDAGKTAEAEAVFLEARKIYEGLVELHPSVPAYRAGRARVENNLGLYYASIARPDEAREGFALAIQYGNWLVTRFPEVAEYRIQLARAYSNLGNLLRSVGRPIPEVNKHYRQAIALLDDLMKHFPEVSEYRYQLAKTHVEQGVLYAAGNQLKEAHQTLLKAWDVADRGERSDVKFPRLLIRIAGHLGDLYSAANDLGKAEKERHLALEGARRVAATSPENPTYQDEVAIRHTYLAYTYANGDRARATTLMPRCLIGQGIGLQVLAPALAATGTPASSWTHLVVALELQQLDAPALAELHFTRARDIWEELARTHPRVQLYRAQLATAWNNLGAHHVNRAEAVAGKVDMKLIEKSRAAYLKAATIWEDLFGKYPQVYRHAVSLGLTYGNLGNVYRDREKPEAAFTWYARGIQTLETVMQEGGETSEVRQRLAGVHAKRAEFYSILRRYQEARADWESALRLSGSRPPLKWRFAYTTTLAHQGEHALATSEAGKLAAQSDLPVQALYPLARVYALAAVAASQDKRLSVSEGKALADEYAARAVALLSLANDRGLFRKRGSEQLLANDPDLASLQQREDFNTLLKQVKKRPG
jgi:serine/threonine protein kinase/tetratricopeptide (TPR) repeat protein